MRTDEELDRAIADLLAEPGREGDPVREALASLYARYVEHVDQVERIVSISDRYQEMLRETLVAAKESESRFSSLVRATSQIVWSTDATGGLNVDVPAWRWMTGQTEADLHGHGWAAALHPDDRARIGNEWEAALTAGHVFRAECRVRAVDGSYRRFAVCGVGVDDGEGTVREWVVAWTDVTELRHAEDARAAQLLAADRLAQFTIVATTLAHEIHNPLAVIRGSVQMLGRIDSVRETAGARIDSIEGATRRIEEIVMRLTELRTLEITGKNGLEHIRLEPENRQ